ncbi:MAG: GNAT family N-acetyltransferase [Bacteroidales bacterium]|nr:GNAT family N-acetyltransferase [Bacteroidales bacterium]
MSSIRVRLADDADKEKIRGLSQRCYQEGMITMLINRTPRFNTLHLLIDPEAWHYVACSEEKIVGLVGVLHFRLRILDKVFKSGYMLDLRVDEDFRRGVAAYRLVKAAIDHIRESDTDMIIANFLKDNRHSLVFTTGKGGIPKARYLGTNRIFNILPLWHMKTDKRFEISKPREKDIPELLELYAKYASGYQIAPVITGDLFRRYIAVEGISLDNFFVARENGKIRAVTAVWDEHTYKSYQVLKLTFTIKVVAKLMKFLSFFMKTPRPVRLNEPLRQLSLVLYGHDDCPEALDTLFRHVNNINRGSKYTLIMYYAHEADPMFRYMKKFTGVSVKSEMYLFAKEASLFENLPENPSPVLFDLTMVL